MFGMTCEKIHAILHNMYAVEGPPFKMVGSNCRNLELEIRGQGVNSIRFFDSPKLGDLTQS